VLQEEGHKASGREALRERRGIHHGGGEGGEDHLLLLSAERAGYTEGQNCGQEGRELAAARFQQWRATAATERAARSGHDGLLRMSEMGGLMSFGLQGKNGVKP
jgi:hypothetical protein